MNPLPLTENIHDGEGVRLNIALYQHPHVCTGRPLSTECGAHAGIALDPGPKGALQLECALPVLSCTEQRWVFDQLLRKVGALFSWQDVHLKGSNSIAVDTILSIVLDLEHRLERANKGGKVFWERSPEQENAAILKELVAHAAEDGAPRGGSYSGLKEAAALETLYRNWVNEDPATRTSLQIAADVQTWSGAWQDNDLHSTRSGARVSVEVFEEAELEKLGCDLLLAVGRGATQSPPRLVIAHYVPENVSTTEAPLMLLGKGVTFDTGGINTKPYESFVSMMKNDMAGAALAFSLFKGLVESGYAKPLVLVIPSCENTVGEEAMRPGSVVRAYNGKTVRIDHTDAEGRLILADALAYASERFAPESVLCFATLTTAALIAYGPFATPVHFAEDNARLLAELEAASAALGEDLHFFPARLWHFKANEDQEADLRNTARLPGHASKGAGSRNAAHFLRAFCDRPLIHFDIFASAWNWSDEAPGAGYGATGTPLRTLLRALRRYGGVI